MSLTGFVADAMRLPVRKNLQAGSKFHCRALSLKQIYSNASAEEAAAADAQTSWQNMRALLLAWQQDNTESSLLPGLSQKRMLHSSVCRFPEFCSSRCSSHFAAPFLVV